jgi:cbb3-type cytochrome oxidase maturation protein
LDILYLLIPLSTGVVLAIIGIFAWALHRGQFDDINDEGRRVLLDGNSNLDRDQSSSVTSSEQSARRMDNTRKT